MGSHHRYTKEVFKKGFSKHQQYTNFKQKTTDDSAETTDFFMKIIDPQTVSVAELHAHLLGTVAPRPIAFASTVDKAGNVNLSPFSYFNVFSIRPPIMVFSTSSRTRDNTQKDTLENVLEHSEVVINIVNYAIVEQMSLSSAEYAKGINEFLKSGLTPEPSQKVKPPRVKESPAAFECKVNQVITLGEEGGAGHLVVCEVLLAYFDEEILDENTTINPYKLDAVARMGANYYCRAQGDAIFALPRPGRKNSMGVDQMPERIRQSTVLTGNNLGRLGMVEQLPDPEAIAAFSQEPAVADLLKRYENDPSTLEVQLHKLAQSFLEKGETEKAWCTILQVTL